MRGPKLTLGGAAPLTRPSGKIFIPKSVLDVIYVRVKFELSISDSSRDIKGTVLPVGSVSLQKRAWHICA